MGALNSAKRGFAGACGEIGCINADKDVAAGAGEVGAGALRDGFDPWFGTPRDDLGPDIVSSERTPCNLLPKPCSPSCSRARGALGAVGGGSLTAAFGAEGALGGSDGSTCGSEAPCLSSSGPDGDGASCETLSGDLYVACGCGAAGAKDKVNAGTGGA